MSEKPMQLRSPNLTKTSSSEETVQAIVRGGSPGGRSETMGVRFVKEVGFKRKRVMDEQSGE